MQVLQIPRENMNTLASGNPTLAVRASLSSSNIASFQLSQLHVEENIARLAWEGTSTAIGAGLSRPELYVSSRETCQAVIHPKTYEALRPSLKSMSLQQLLSPLSLHSGAELQHAARCRLIVVGLEIGGRWSDEAADFIRVSQKYPANMFLAFLFEICG